MRPWTAVLNCNDLGWLLGVLVLSLCCLDHGFGIEPDILPSQRYCLLAGSAFCFDSPRAGAKEPFTSYSLQQICRGAWQPRHRSSLLIRLKEDRQVRYTVQRDELSISDKFDLNPVFFVIAWQARLSQLKQEIEDEGGHRRERECLVCGVCS